MHAHKRSSAYMLRVALCYKHTGNELQQIFVLGVLMHSHVLQATNKISYIVDQPTHNKCRISKHIAKVPSLLDCPSFLAAKQHACLMQITKSLGKK